jgi:hypothetical protein
MCETSWRAVASSGRSRLMRHHPFLIHRTSERAHSRKPAFIHSHTYRVPGRIGAHT